MDLDRRTYMVEDILLKVDRGSMAHALEVRPPLLDRNVLAFSAALPIRHKLRGLHTTKYLLRRVLDRHLPASLYRMPKRGFTVPMAQWLRGELAVRARQLLDPERLAATGLFAPATVQNLLAEHQSARADHTNVLWALMSFEAWRERFGIEAATPLPDVVLEPAPRRAAHSVPVAAEVEAN
jgi:asparagine synthase (glutamine-hydrolysing)